MANKNKALNSIDKLFGLSIDKQQTERSDAQVAYSAAQGRLGKEFAAFCLKRSQARPEALEAVDVVDIRDNAIVGSTSGCSNDNNSAITGQEQG